MSHKPWSGVVAIAACLAFSSGRPAAAGADRDQAPNRQPRLNDHREVIQQLLEQRSTAVVAVRFVQKSNLLGQETESELEVPGVMVSSDGLVLTSSAGLLGPLMMMGSVGLPGMDIPRPSQVSNDNYRIVVGDGAEALAARLISRDRIMDLAWLKITDRRGRVFDHINFNDAAALQIGDTLYTVLRMPHRFDRKPLAFATVVGGRIERPRPMFVAPGVPPGSVVFNAEGRVAGFAIAQPPQDAEVISTSEFLGLSFILPPSWISASMQQAREASTP